MSLSLQDKLNSTVALTPTKWQQKFLQNNQTTNVTMTDLTFSNLEIGKTYKASWQSALRVNVGSANSSVSFDVIHDTVVIAVARVDVTADTVSDRTISGGSCIFTATATNLTFLAVSASAISESEVW